MTSKVDKLTLGEEIDKSQLLGQKMCGRECAQRLFLIVVVISQVSHLIQLFL